MSHIDDQRPAGTSPARSNSSNTLEADRVSQNDTEEKANGPNSGEKDSDEKGQGDEEKSDGIPKPVGFFDPTLHKTRIEVAWKWLATSKYTFPTKLWT